MESDILRHPTIVDENGNHSNEITATRSLWMHDYTDLQRNAVTFQIWASTVACFLSLTMILAVIVPLLKKSRRNRASTYNLYLVFLAIPDLVYNGFLVFLFATFERWTVPSDDPKTFPVIDHPYDVALFLCCGATSLYTNAIIAYEIMRLLRNSKRRKRCKAPNLKTATMQAGCTYTFGVAIFMFDHYLADAIYDAAPGWVAKWIIIPLNLTLTVLLPIFYLCWVCFRIYWEGLFFGAGSRAGKRLAVLVRYFTRLIVIYIGLWVPITVLYMHKFDNAKNPGLYYYQACVIYSIQVWVSFGLSLTKPDVRKNVVSLLNCYKKRPQDDSGALTSTFNSKTQTVGCGSPCKDPNGDGTGDENCIGSEETTPISDEDPDSSIKTEENDNIFDFGGADAPIEVDPDELPMHHRFFMRRHKSSSDLNAEPSNTSYRMDGNGSQILLGTARSGSGVMSEPFTLESIRGSFQNITKKVRPSMARKSISRASITRANIESFTLPTNQRRAPRRSGGRPGGRLPKIQSERMTSSGFNPAGGKDKITNYRIGMENQFSEHNKIGVDTIEKLKDGDTIERLRDDTLSSRGLDLDDTMLDSFFLDQTPPSNHGGGYRATPKQHRRWMKDLRRNIRALGRQLKSSTTLEEQRNIYRQSLYHQKKALEMASTFSSNLGTYGSSRERTQKSASSESEKAETIWSESHNAETIWTDVQSDDSSSSSSSACSTISDDSAIHPSSSNDDGVDSSTKKRWIAELRQNIFDMTIMVDQEECTEAQRAVMQRAIDSQKQTLISLQCIDEAQFATIQFGTSGSGGAHAINNYESVDNHASNTFVKVPLEAIIDTSEDFRCKSDGGKSDHRHSDCTQKMSGSSEQRWSGSEKQRRSGDIEGQQLQEVDEKRHISWRGEA